MSTTYYLLRVKGSAQGDGAYLGADAGGETALVALPVLARRFPTLPDAEHFTGQVVDQFGAFEIEVRTSPD